jgi:hypothetical protein
MVRTTRLADDLFDPPTVVEMKQIPMHTVVAGNTFEGAEVTESNWYDPDRNLWRIAGRTFAFIKPLDDLVNVGVKRILRQDECRHCGRADAKYKNCCAACYQKMRRSK